MWMIIQIKSFVSHILSAILDTLFPPYCYMCKKEGESLCGECLSSIKKPIDTPYPYIISVYSFKDYRIKRIIYAIKYFHRKDLLAPLARALADTLSQEATVPQNVYVILPIPMPTIRRYIRGYNHAEAFAHDLVKYLHTVPSQEHGLRYCVDTTILTRISSKKRQVLTTSKRERLLNQRNAFMVRKDISGKNIILLDDVTTTGATLSEARRILILHGAKSVRAYTIAH